MYCVVESGDGGGKDSQVDLLVSRLEREGLNPRRVAEPCEELPTGKLLRQFLKTGEYPAAHAALFLADRMALQETIIRPALDEGRPVISCRSFLSTLTYQQDNWPLTWLLDIHRIMLAKPNVVIWLDLNPETGMERVNKRASTKEIFDELSIQQRNWERYCQFIDPAGEHHQTLLSLMDTPPHILRVDACLTREEIHQTIWTFLQERGLVT